MTQKKCKFVRGEKPPQPLGTLTVNTVIMEQYAVAHVSKGKGASNGLRAHIERETTPENADPSRSALNRIEDHGQNKSLSARADAVIQAAGVTRKVQADAVKYCPVILSGSPERMAEIEAAGQLDSWYSENKRFMEERYGKSNIISFALHRDEKTPHIHCVVVPVIRDQDKSGNTRARLSARDLFNPDKLKALQTDYAQQMGCFGLERGKEGSRAKHTTVQQFYKQLPDLIKTKEAELQAKKEAVNKEALELVALKAQYAQYSAGKGLKMAAEGVGEFLSGGKKKREGLETEVVALRQQVQELGGEKARLENENKQTLAYYGKVEASLLKAVNEALAAKEAGFSLCLKGRTLDYAEEPKNTQNRGLDREKGRSGGLHL